MANAPLPGTFLQNHFPQLLDGDGMPSTGTEDPDPARLYELLDTLVALRLEFADGADGESAISGFGAQRYWKSARYWTRP